MGKRSRRRVRERNLQVESRRAAAVEAVAKVGRPSRRASLEELRMLVGTRAVLDRRIDDVVDELAGSGVGWVPIAEVLGVTRQGARQASLRRRVERA